MTWLSVSAAVVYYLLLPFIIVFRWLIVALAPVLHLGHYFATAFLLPWRLLGKFETVYIYLGVAALVGVLTGSILHLSSTVLISLFNLNHSVKDEGRSAASVRAARSQKKLEDAWGRSILKGETRAKEDAAIEEKYAVWLEKSSTTGPGDGLLGQTILEEDDDSDEF